ncbi:NAD(P)-dependent oxidoreductase, partial [Flavobacteriaceae bacterium]|nr:NAD(P)-dependent oxidoreductase [Flavobacteriaceae bacterium]
MINILLTGHSGFLGTHIKKYLAKKNYNVVKLGRSIDSDIVCDLSIETFKSENIDFVVHAAGKAHVIPKSKDEINSFYKVNFQGTKNLIQGVSKCNIKTIIFISTVAVYGKDKGELIDENEPLNGCSPYAVSKIKSEEILHVYGKKHNVRIVVLRLPLITGENPVGNLRSITVAIKKGYYFRIGNGEAKKSIISASDVARAIPELFKLSGVYNYTDCVHPRICEIDNKIATNHNKKIKVLPLYLMRFLSKIGDFFPFFPFDKSKFEKLTTTLTFSNE